MPKLRINDIELFYELHGKGEPLFLICGFTNHLGIWEKMIPMLSKNFEVIVFDNRGAGRSSASSPPYTIEMLAADTIALMDGLSIFAASMVGFSMGAAITQMIALNHPDRIKKGVLLSSFNTLPKTAAMQAINTAKLFQAGVKPALTLEALLPWIYSNEYLSESRRVEKTVQELLSNPYPQAAEGYIGQLEALLHFDITDMLHQIQTEMLIIHGDADLYTPLYSAQILKEKMQNATLEVIPDASHMLLIERANEMEKLIYAFCKS